jgi:microcystin-dependent protein
MADPFIGEIRMFCGNFAPNGWALCNGQLLSISQYQALFSILGTTFGGNGTTNFALPNLQGRVPIHWGQGQGLSPYNIGQTGGAETVGLSVAQMPAHNHQVNASPNAATTTVATANVPATVTSTERGQQAPSVYSSNAPSVAMNNGMISPTGGGAPHTNIQPYQCVTFIIALNGIYPSRS